jgi:Hep_Hag.
VSGYTSYAMGSYSSALGYTCAADGTGAVALGYRCTANGDYSIAIGQRASANNFNGAFVLSDASTTDSTLATASNQFSARYAGGYRLFSNATRTVGVSLAAGGNSWASISDSSRKENFEPASGETF